MSEADLYLELKKLTKDLNYSVLKLRENGTAYAESERAYKVLLRQEILKMRSEGMAVGIIDKTCHGIPTVAQKRFERDVAEATYKANQEAIQSIKLQMRIVESQISREWNS